MESKTLENGLIRILASTVVLSGKARFFSWCARKTAPKDAIDLFAKDFAALDPMCDEFAARVSAAGGQVPSAYGKLAEVSSVKEYDGLSWIEMVQELRNDHQQMIFDCQFVLTLLEDLDDTSSVKLLLDAISKHETCIEKLSAIVAH